MSDALEKLNKAQILAELRDWSPLSYVFLNGYDIFWDAAIDRVEETAGHNVRGHIDEIGNLHITCLSILGRKTA